MENGQEFVDYYEVLKVNPDCDARILELAYHYFAKMYHPDNTATSDPDKFGEVVEAYRVLRDPERRAAYDRSFPHGDRKPAFQTPLDSDLALDETEAIADAEMHARILLALYKQRREQPSEAGVIGWFIQDKLGCSEDHFQFHIWYLKSKGMIEATEQGTIAITVQGIDHVISTSRAAAAEPLRIRQADAPPDWMRRD